MDFMRKIPKGSYYFFDYYLTSGSAWKGPIGEETITLELDGSWLNHTLHCNVDTTISKSDSTDNSTTLYVYSFKNQDPSTNLYFALSPFTSNR